MTRPISRRRVLQGAGAGAIAGFGCGAVVALATQPTDGVRRYQEQDLYSDGGPAAFTRITIGEPGDAI